MSIIISCGLTEDGVIAGNLYDKYSSRNPIVRWLMKNFNAALTSFVSTAAPLSIHEVGCGEGYWVLQWNQQGIPARGTDFSSQVIDIARENAKGRGYPATIFSVRNVYDLDPEQDSADLIVCCEVLEHLDDPHKGLRALQKIVSKHLIISVPNEPLWCILNLARGEYVKSFRNTPGHMQHWSRKQFLRLVFEYFEIIEDKNPVPWSMLLCRVRR